MKLALVMALAGLVTLADPGGKKEEAKPYDLVPAETSVVFPSAGELMQRKMRFLVRDLGVRELVCEEFCMGLVVVWDGKECGFRMGGAMGALAR